MPPPNWTPAKPWSRRSCVGIGLASLLVALEGALIWRERPQIGTDLRVLIRRMSIENPLGRTANNLFNNRNLLAV